MERKVANIYEDTREQLNELKSVFDFKSDDQAIKFMCEIFMTDDKFDLIKKYAQMKTSK